MKERIYRCEECGEVVEWNWLTNKVADWLSTMIVMDPAPSLPALFEKCRCPKCGSKRVKTLGV